MQLKKKTPLSWDEQAEAFMKDIFLPRAKGQPFLTEQFRNAATKFGLTSPADLRKWGGFIIRMKKQGVIRGTGFRLDGYGSPKTLWRSI